MQKIARNIVITTATLAIVGLGAAKLIANKQEVANKVYIKDPNATVSVNTITVQPSSFTKSTQYVGTFEPQRQVVVGAETSGRIIKVNIKEGMSVGAGALIAQVDNELNKAQLYNAEASLENATTTLERYKNASLGDGVSAMDLDRQLLQKKSAEAQVRQIKKQVAMCTITAPFPGVITEKMVELGAMVAPGTQLAKLADVSSLKLEIAVPENELQNFKEGSSIQVTTDVYPEEILNGKIEFVGVSADAAHQFKVKILVANNKKTPLKVGMYGKVKADNDDANALIIPRGALVGSSKKPQVYVMKEGRAQLVDIQLGRSNDTELEVVNGLNSGDVVITTGLLNLTTGTKVSAIK